MIFKQIWQCKLMQIIHDSIQRKLWQTHIKLRRNRVKRERKLIHKELQNYRDKLGSAPDENDPIWVRLSSLQEHYLELRWLKRKKKLDLLHPRTLAEKIEWLKLNDHRTVHQRLTDKIAVREYVINSTGNPNLLNALHGVYSNAHEIPIDELPSKFVVKANQWSGGNFICTNKDNFNSEVKDRLNLYMNGIYGQYKAEWPYWHIKPMLLVEEYLEDEFSELVDYKIFCFNGEPKFIMVCMGRYSQSTMRRLFFDTDWNLMPFLDYRYPAISLGDNFPRPHSLSEMLRYVRFLCQDVAFIRADFYDVFGECRFGELTLYPESGTGCWFHPHEWNITIGDWLRLPEPNRNPQMAYSVV